MGSHSVTCHLTEVIFPPLPQQKLVLDLATPEGCKAESSNLSTISIVKQHAEAAAVPGIWMKKKSS